MNKKLFFYAMPVCLLVFGSVLASCGGSSRLAGVWELDRVENGSSRGVVQNFEFFKDGTGNLEGRSITWRAENNRIMITTAGGQAQSVDYKLSGSTLTLIYDTTADHKAIYNKK